MTKIELLESLIQVPNDAVLHLYSGPPECKYDPVSGVKQQPAIVHRFYKFWRHWFPDESPQKDADIWVIQ